MKKFQLQHYLSKSAAEDIYVTGANPSDYFLPYLERGTDVPHNLAWQCVRTELIEDRQVYRYTFQAEVSDEQWAWITLGGTWQ